MQNDRTFTAYAIALVVGLGTVLTILVTHGTATLPPALMFVADVALALTIRASYKSFDGEGGFYALIDGISGLWSQADESVVHGAAHAES